LVVKNANLLIKIGVNAQNPQSVAKFQKVSFNEFKFLDVYTKIIQFLSINSWHYFLLSSTKFSSVFDMSWYVKVKKVVPVALNALENGIAEPSVTTIWVGCAAV
jgi:hypothetical protein